MLGQPAVRDQQLQKPEPTLGQLDPEIKLAQQLY